MTKLKIMLQLKNIMLARSTQKPKLHGKQYVKLLKCQLLRSICVHFKVQPPFCITEVMNEYLLQL